MRPLGRDSTEVKGVAQSHSTARRAMIILIAAMQLVLPAALTVADGYLELRAPENAVFAHIEAHGTPRCPRVHQEDNCAICHFLSRAGGVKPEGPPAPRILERIPSHVSTQVRVAARCATVDPTLPRAPPTA
jgi:hypothetical protein